MYIKHDKVRIKRIVLELHDVIADSRKVVLFKYEIPPSCNISNTSDSVSSGYPNTEKRVENMTRSGVFFTKFEVFR